MGEFLSGIISSALKKSTKNWVNYNYSKYETKLENVGSTAVERETVTVLDQNLFKVRFIHIRKT